MTFFYDLNKKLATIADKPETRQLNERDMSRAAKGYEKYGKEGMEALAKAGREGKDLDKVRDKYNKYDESVDEGIGDITKKVGKFAQQAGRAVGGLPGTIARGAKRAMDVIAPGDETLLKKLQQDVGMPQTGKPPMAKSNQVKEKMNPAKAKSFAALAEPKDKITFADKIAGAKKEVDEVLGDVAANAMKKAISGHGTTKDKSRKESWDDMMKDVERRRSEVKPGHKVAGAKGDIEKTATGIRHTRRYDDKTGETDTGDETGADGQPAKRGRGRPKGSTGKIGAKGPSGKSKLMTREGDQDPAEKGEYDREGDMALDDIDTIESAANELQAIIDADENLPEWVQSKINKAMDYLDTARDYMKAQGNDAEPVAEKAVSKKQQRFMGMVHAAQKGEKPASKEVGKVAKTMKKSDAEDFAKTKHKGLPEKKKKEEVEETTVAGNVATSAAAPKSSGKSGVQFGKGIYDSMNRDLEAMIAESMNISMSMNNDSMHGGASKSLTVTATDDDAVKLAALLKMAGLGSGGDESMAKVDENSPDWPTNTESSDDALQYSGGLNKPKSTGQTTVPVIAGQENRMMTYEEQDDLARLREMAGIREAKKEVDEEETAEGNRFTGNLAKARAAGKDQADLDGDGDMEKVRESVNSLWKQYQG